MAETGLKEEDLFNNIDPSFVMDWDELEIITQVGAGAFAEVFEALRCGERVAVKKLISQSDPVSEKKALKELQHEVTMMAQLHSGYVVTLYGVCFKPPNLCMAMEFLPHGSLNHLIYNTTVDMSWDRRWSFARDAALGMNYLHTRKPPILHRDLKSGNLLLATDGRVKLTDFGLSVFKEDSKNLSANLPTTTPTEQDFQGGTDRWTAPEIIDGEKYTEAADVFSYGVILYEIATRKLPFHDTPPEEVRKLWLKGDRPPIPDDTPQDFSKLIKMCWEQSPRRRPTFTEIVAYFRKRGKISTISTEKTQGRYTDEKEKLERENEVLMQLKENLERKRDEADRAVERERKRRIEVERDFEESEKKLTEERNKRIQLEKEIQDLTRNARIDSDKLRQLEDAKKDVEKKIKSLKKKAESSNRDELEKANEEADKRISEERARVQKLSAQLKEQDQRIEEQESKRNDLEKKIAELSISLENERKKTEEANRSLETSERKLKQEKKKLEQEKKRREEVEVELEEEQKKNRRNRSTGARPT